MSVPMRWVVLAVALGLTLDAAIVRATDDDLAKPMGTLRFRVLDSATGEPTAARVTVLDDAGRSHVAAAAVPVAGECMDPAPEGWKRAPEGGLPGAGLVDPASGAKVFYVDGPIEMRLPVGRYRVTVAKGFEWESRSIPVEVFPGQSGEVPIRVSRWIDMPKRGWVSSDGHLHISRPSAQFDPLVASWMAGEDLHVANLLQMGAPDRIVGGRQYAFGGAGRYREGDVLLSPGQENPRTWLLGHGIVLGASEYIDDRERYLVYQPVWARAAAEGALSGYAHWNPPGVVVDAPTGLLDVLEVLQFDTPQYEMLYRMWGLGLMITPIAGTDFPCIGDLPGADRFYARVGRAFTWERWVAAVAAGKTFVTNGPMLEFDVNGTGIGGRVRLDGPEPVLVRGAVSFDPTRDDVRALELVHDGEVVHRETAVAELGRIAFSLRVPVETSSWLALRSTGVKLGRRPHADRLRDSAAHTSAVEVRVAGTPPIGTGAAARRVASRARQEMAELKELFASAQEAGILARPRWLRGVDAETLHASRDEVLAEIGLAEAWYASRAARPPTGLASAGGSPGSRRSSRTPDGAFRPRP